MQPNVNNLLVTEYIDIKVDEMPNTEKTNI